MQPWPRVATVAALFLTVAAAMYGIKLIYDPVIQPVLEVAAPFVIAIVLAFLLDPLVDRFQKLGLARGVGVAIVGLTFLIVFVMAGLLLVPNIADQASRLAGNYDASVDQVQAQINRILEHNAALLERFHLPKTASELANRFSTQLQGVGGKAIDLLRDLLTGMLSKILWIVIIPLSTLYILRDFDYIKAKIVHLTPDRHRERLLSFSGAIGGVFGNYVRGMMTVAILYSLTTMLVLTIVGLDYALIIGAVSGLFYMVPYVGVAIITIITGLAAIVQPGSSAGYAGVLMAYLLVQSFIVYDQLITPRVVGGSVGVHPVLALFSLALGAKMFGVVGMIAAVPVAASLQVALGQAFPKLLDRVGRPGEKEKPAKRPPKPWTRRRRGE